MDSITHKPVCAIVGVGPGNGEALARAFAEAGHAVALIARSAAFCETLAAALPNARAYVCDATDIAEVERTFARIANEMGDVDTLIYNAGKGLWGAMDQIDVGDFEQAWRTNALGLLLVARRVVPAMKTRGAGCVLVVGATASRRGIAGTAAFAPAKMAQRGLAESMARYLGPHGIHVALLILDGAVGGPETRAQLRGRLSDAFIDPRAIAATALQLVAQDRSAWSFEVDLRPYSEKW